MSKPKEQHIIPKVYLKNFQIDNDKNKSFVWCLDFSDKYNFRPKRLGINDKLFKQFKYYNDNRLIDPFAIEETMARYFEPIYNDIISSIQKESPLSEKIVGDIMIWLYISKWRSPIFRANTHRLMKWSISTINGYNKIKSSAEEDTLIDKHVKKLSREIHLSYFYEPSYAEDQVKTFINTINAKHWCVLKSYKNFPFWTNDNPGFSPNMNPVFSKDFPFHNVMELNSHSIIYFVLSPNYCLEITPFPKGTPLNACALNMNIEFKQASPALIDFINRGVFYSRYRLLISSSVELFENCIEKVVKD